MIAAAAERNDCYLLTLDNDLGRDADAVVDYTKSLELKKEPLVLFNRNAYLRQKQFEKAKADFKMVIKISKDPTMVENAKNNLQAAEEGRTQ